MDFILFIEFVNLNALLFLDVACIFQGFCSLFYSKYNCGYAVLINQLSNIPLLTFFEQPKICKRLTESEVKTNSWLPLELKHLICNCWIHQVEQHIP